MLTLLPDIVCKPDWSLRPLLRSVSCVVCLQLSSNVKVVPSAYELSLVLHQTYTVDKLLNHF